MGDHRDVSDRRLYALLIFAAFALVLILGTIVEVVS